MMEKEGFNMIMENIIGAAIEVHRAIGLLESTYEVWLAFEPLSRGEQR